MKLNNINYKVLFTNHEKWNIITFKLESLTSEGGALDYSIKRFEIIKESQRKMYSICIMQLDYSYLWIIKHPIWCTHSQSCGKLILTNSLYLRLSTIK